MSIDVSVETTIERPIGEVVAYVIDPANEPAWIQGIVESTPITPDPVGVGSKARRVAKFMGRRIEYTPEVTEFEPGRRLLMQTNVPFPMTIEYSFADQDGRTVVRQRLRGGPSGIMALADPLMAMMVKRNVGGDMRRLRDLLNSRARRA